MAFDERGRLFVGMGPQYRNPTPETPGDSVVIVQDTDGDGRADDTKEFATGFNAIQGLAWHGRDLWVANAPDLTVVRDRDGDDEADEYIKLYTDLGNLEHGLDGLNLVNDWLQRTTYLWRPQWDGALLRPAGGGFTPFIEGGKSLFRPTDLEFGPDGALWVLGWSTGYGAEWKDGELTNEGRIFRVAWKNAPPAAALLTQDGGMLRSSSGKKTAKETWGQPAAWCDYSGTSGERSSGITLMASPGNFRESWWHNRDYGVFVANPFGREAMKQGARSTVTVSKGETFRIAFGALIHHHQTIDLAEEFKAFKKLSAADEADNSKR